MPLLFIASGLYSLVKINICQLANRDLFYFADLHPSFQYKYLWQPDNWKLHVSTPSHVVMLQYYSACPSTPLSLAYQKLF